MLGASASVHCMCGTVWRLNRVTPRPAIFEALSDETEAFGSVNAYALVGGQRWFPYEVVVVLVY